MESNNLEAQNTQDLHELVTLEPNNNLYTATPSQPPPPPDSAPHSSAGIHAVTGRNVSAPAFSHSPSIFSPGFADRSTSPPASSSTLPSRPRLPFMSLDSAAEAPTSLRWPQPPTSTRLSLSRKPPIQRAEKDSDDVETSLDRRRRSIQTTNAATSSTINRLFAGKLSVSPEASPPPSHQQRAARGLGYMRALSGDTAPLPQHLQQRGLVEGRHSDITVKVFGASYNLHRIILDRAPFFASALSEPWAEAHQKEIELHPEEVDSSITQRTFELALKRLYGCHNSAEEDADAIGLFATACWLEMQDVVDYSVESILRRMQAGTVAPMLTLVTSNYYGKAGDKILASAKAVISRNGWQMPLKFWDGVPSDLIHELIGGDGFFVHGEWERWLLAKRLLDRRLKSAARAAGLGEHGSSKMPAELKTQAIRSTTFEESADDVSIKGDSVEVERWAHLYKLQEIEPLLLLLDECVHYMHMDFEQLQSIRSARDIFGVPLVPDKILADALWSGLELRQRILNARDKELTLGLSQTADDSIQESSHSPSYAKKRPDRPELRSTDSLLNLGNGAISNKRFWIPSSDCNIVIGGNTESVITSTSNAHRQASRLSSALQADDGGPWFSDLSADRQNDTAHSDPRPTLYSAFPPFRFSAEFPNPRVLKERKRVYSRTVFYAGSFWNVYIQKVRSGSKNPQLGVYLHRAKERDLDGSLGVASSSVEERTGAWERDLLMRSQQRSFRQRTRTFQPDADHAGHGADLDDLSSGGDGDAPRLSSSRPGLSTFMTSSRRKHKTTARHSMPPGGYGMHLNLSNMPGVGTATPYFSSSASSPSDVDSDSSADEAFDLYNEPAIHIRNTGATLPPYTDARPTIKTYFKIYSPSKGGRTMSVYESAPDTFNFRQSWGWKSSSLMLDDEFEGGGEGQAGAYGLSTVLRGEDDADEPLMSGMLGPDADGVVGSAGLPRDEDASGALQGRANLRFTVVLGVV